MFGLWALPPNLNTKVITTSIRVPRSCLINTEASAEVLCKSTLISPTPFARSRLINSRRWFDEVFVASLIAWLSESPLNSMSIFLHDAALWLVLIVMLRFHALKLRICDLHAFHEWWSLCIYGISVAVLFLCFGRWVCQKTCRDPLNSYFICHLWFQIWLWCWME